MISFYTHSYMYIFLYIDKIFIIQFKIHLLVIFINEDNIQIIYITFK